MKRVWHFVPRPPRYPALTEEQFTLEINPDSQSGPPDDPPKVTLTEVSRRGLRFRSARYLPPGAKIRVTLGLRGGQSWRTTAVVRWCAADSDSYVCGCVLTEPMPWELLGELILRGCVAAT